MQDLWKAVDGYITEMLISKDPVLDAAMRDSVAAGLPQINVTPTQGRFLHLMARVQGAHRILEIGTLGGYSSIWLGRALPDDGKLITLESEPKHADVARKNIARAGLSGVVQIRLGRALDTLPQLQAEGRGPFDLFFIDADKQNIPEYFTWALKLSRPGSLIIVDNVIRNGAVIESRSSDPSVQGVRRFNELLATETRVVATELQTVGSKGYDGFAIALVKGI